MEGGSLTCLTMTKQADAGRFQFCFSPDKGRTTRTDAECFGAGNFGREFAGQGISAIGYWGAADVIIWANIWELVQGSSSIAYRDLAVAGAKILEIDNLSIDVPNYASHSRGWDFGSKPSAFAAAPLEVLLRSLPPFPVYSLGGNIDGGNWGGESASGDCGNAGVARAGIRGLPGVLSTKVCVLLRPGGVERYSGELGITLMVSSYVYFWASVSALSASFSVISESVNGRTETLL
jgi:hypothetical protein